MWGKEGRGKGITKNRPAQPIDAWGNETKEKNAWALGVRWREEGEG